MAEMRRYGTDKGFSVTEARIGLKSRNGGYPCGFVTIGGKLYKVTTCPSRKDDITEWVTIRECKKRSY